VAFALQLNYVFRALPVGNLVKSSFPYNQRRMFFFGVTMPVIVSILDTTKAVAEQLRPRFFGNPHAGQHRFAGSANVAQVERRRGYSGYFRYPVPERL